MRSAAGPMFNSPSSLLFISFSARRGGGGAFHPARGGGAGGRGLLSQGAIVAVDVALKTSARLGGVVAISSTALPEDMLQSVVGYEAPILGTHGK